MKQVLLSGSNPTINELIFNDCYIRGFRGVIRGQKNNDNFLNINFKGCTIDGVGDQGVVTIADKGGDFRNVTFDDCTITNIVLLCDLRKTQRRRDLLGWPKLEWSLLKLDVKELSFLLLGLQMYIV